MRLTRPFAILAATIGLIVILAVPIGLRWFRSDSPAKPNIILISIDTCRADYLGCYDPQRQTTPNIDRFADSATLFENAVSPVPLTLPAHATMLTGQIPMGFNIHNNGYHLRPETVTLAEILQDQGYTTAAFVSAAVLDSRFGIDQGFGLYDDADSVTGGGRGKRRGDVNTRQTMDWLAQHSQDGPLFVFLHYYDPHSPYEPPAAEAGRWPDDPYAGEVAFVDRCIGQMLTQLQQLGLYDESLIILTSDHGEMLGEHGEPEHGYFIYDSAIKVP
ncbi:MAG: sulfatase, partial [Planctomycetota bacterium]